MLPSEEKSPVKLIPARKGLSCTSVGKKIGNNITLKDSNTKYQTREGEKGMFINNEGKVVAYEG